MKKSVCENIVYDLTPLIDLMALDTNDQDYFRELTAKNKLYWKYYNQHIERSTK